MNSNMDLVVRIIWALSMRLGNGVRIADVELNEAGRISIELGDDKASLTVTAMPFPGDGDGVEQ